MAKIDSMLPTQHVGDNRHSPLKIVDAKLHPYDVRPQESRDIERRVAPKRRKLSKKAAEEKVKEIAVKVRPRAGTAK